MKQIFKDYLNKGGLALLFLSLVCVILGVTDVGATNMGMAAGDGNFSPSGTDEAQGKPGFEGAGVHVDGMASVDTGKNEQTELFAPFYDDELVKIHPDKAILDTMLRKMTPRNVNSLNVKWGSADIKSVETYVSEAYVEDKAKTTAVLKVDNAQIFTKNSTIRVPSIQAFESDGTTLSNKSKLQLRVRKVDGNEITVYATNGGKLTTSSVRKTQKYVPSIPINTKIYRLGSAVTEKDVQTGSSIVLPSVEENFIQTHMCQVDITKWYQKNNKNIEWEKADIEEMALFQYRMDMESTILYGDRTQSFDEDQGVDTYTSNGIDKYIVKEYDYTTFTNDDFVDMTEAIFTKNSGSTRRVLLAGSKFISNVSKIEWGKYKDITVGKEARWGITWKTIETNFGTLYLIHHELMDFHGDSENAFVIDPQFLYKYIFEAQTKKDYDGTVLGTVNADSSVTKESFCPGLGYPSCHMKIVKA